MLVDQIPRNSQLWFLFSLVWVLLPHIEHLPGWVSVAAAMVFIWRAQIYRGRWNAPGIYIKTALVLVCGFGIWRGYGSWRGVEVMTGLLLVGMLLKLLEMRSRRDALLVVYLGYFAAAAQLLFSQTILATIYCFASLLWLLSAQQLLFSDRQMRLVDTLKMTAKTLAIALPVMLALFFVMPRSGPLWAMPMQKNAAKTGISDTMAPGDVVDLTRSAQLAFRVKFEGAIPPPAQRYWRGLVLSVFDGRRWSQRQFNSGHSDDQIFWQGDEFLQQRLRNYSAGNLLNYELLMEPSHRPWLFTLGAPLDVKSKRRWGVTSDATLLSRRPIDERQKFTISSAPVNLLAPPVSQHGYRYNLRLPQGFNPQTVSLAQRWRLQEADDRKLIAKFLQWIATEFTYTLQPPALGEHSVDEFLLGTKRGFCEHFASSFVVFARAAGIPARVVTGYQGGEVSADGDYLLVHQMDAHAWAEVWLDGQWSRVDPTSAVAPNRIELGLRELLSQAGLDLPNEDLSLMKFSNVAWLNNARLQWDQLNYNWQRRVVGFDKDDQQSLLSDWLGGLEPWRIGVAFLLFAGLPMAVLAVWMGWANRPAPLSAEQKLLAQFERRLAGVADKRAAGETLADFFARLQRQLPHRKVQLESIAKLFEQCLYGDAKQQSQREQALRQRISAWRPTADETQSSSR